MSLYPVLLNISQPSCSYFIKQSITAQIRSKSGMRIDLSVSILFINSDGNHFSYDMFGSDFPSDLWSLGCTWTEMSTRKHPRYQNGNDKGGLTCGASKFLAVSSGIKVGEAPLSVPSVLAIFL
ncbi:hypothetical protein SADUNF_Sadunf17G0016000 [Salix dunnii]|uniref:Uncharacterized protein n=1 Tax=Salix dunnii TaxID=1413687 RepID=A0A835J7K8_9ROSI|nr:hypothetical protein SADUNF_Sadunf17G0016000 [Salix dunnii]